MTRIAFKVSRCKSRISGLLALVLILAYTMVVRSSYQMFRPIADGMLNQGYLWGGASILGTHKGVDLLYPTGTDVRAVAEGVVVAVENGVGDEQHPPELPFGNYVLIRHAIRHYDATTGSNAYTYTITHICVLILLDMKLEVLSRQTR